MYRTTPEIRQCTWQPLMAMRTLSTGFVWPVQALVSAASGTSRQPTSHRHCLPTRRHCYHRATIARVALGLWHHPGPGEAVLHRFTLFGKVLQIPAHSIMLLRTPMTRKRMTVPTQKWSMTLSLDDRVLTRIVSLHSHLKARIRPKMRPHSPLRQRLLRGGTSFRLKSISSNRALPMYSLTCLLCLLCQHCLITKRTR